MVIEFKKRKTQRVGYSLWVSLPFEWVNHHGLTKGDVIIPELDKDNERLILRPQKRA